MQSHSPISTLTLSLLPLLFFSAGVDAQMSNAPYAFKNNISGGVGMSAGGREAIINDKIHGIRPDNLVRGPGGELLDVQKGPGGSAITTYAGTGQVIPQYRGTSFRGDHPEIAAGVYNGYFIPSMVSSSYATPVVMYSGTVSTWTSRVISGMPISYVEGNVIEGWTGQVFIMNTPN